MSYRTFKRALGETNLERKCRFLFGACLLPLIAGSFWWYGSETDKVVFRHIGEELANAALIEAHLTSQENNKLFQRADEAIAELLRRRQYKWQTLHPKNEHALNEPTDATERELMEKWSQLSQKLKSDEAIDALEPPSFRRMNTVAAIEQGELEDAPSEARDDSSLIYQYYEPVFAKEGCIFCHSKPGMDVYWPDLRVGALLAVIRVDIDAKEIKQAQSRNRALLLVAAIVTVFLAMIALYVIVRYVIVKPLRHLRDVSNAIRSGEVDQRADIHTGDEFEELGAAFNRMLRQLLRQQDELRSVNDELDGKIDEMAQANMRLFEMNQLKSDFLATISHELRTPLNSIIGFSDLLSSVDRLNEKELRYAGNIQRSGKQLLVMINDILDLAKIESGKMEVRPTGFEVGVVLPIQCDMARPLSEKKNIDLDCEIAPGLPPMHQDQGKLEQILNNLLSNAIKFTPDGGRISVAVNRDQRGDLRLTVSDTGVGISESEQSLVFEKFRQGTNVLPGGNAMTREYSGTGLGLSIVRELCRLLGGDITLESELGKGSVFTVHLPWTLTELPKMKSPLADELKQMTKPRSEMPTVASAIERDNL